MKSLPLVILLLKCIKKMNISNSCTLSQFCHSLISFSNSSIATFDNEPSYNFPIKIFKRRNGKNKTETKIFLHTECHLFWSMQFTSCIILHIPTLICFSDETILDLNLHEIQKYSRVLPFQVYQLVWKIFPSGPVIKV